MDPRCPRPRAGRVSRRPRGPLPALVLTAAILGLGAGVPAAAEAGSHTVELNDQAPYFRPKRLHVEPGDTVTWENRGPGLIHTILVVTEQGESRSGPIQPGESWQHTFTGDAVVKSSCEIHPYMYGIVVVGDPPASLIAAVESQAAVPASPGISLEVVEFPMPVEHAVPGIVAIDRQDNVWVTLGGGGWGNIAHPPLPYFARLTADGDISVYETPSPASGPSGIHLGEDGTVFVTALMGGLIVRLDPRSGSIEEFPVPTEPSWPTGLDLDAHGNLWFNQTKGDKLGMLTPDGAMLEIPVPTPGAHPTGLGIDSHGNVWIAQRDTSKIGCYQANGVWVEYAIPAPRAKPAGILVDRRDRVWFAQREGNRIGVIENGQMREYPLPTPKSGPFFLAEDARGLIWFSQVYGNRIGVLDPETGKVVEFSIPTADSWPGGIAFDSQGALWFAEHLGNKVGMIPDVSAAVRAVLTPDDPASSPTRAATESSSEPVSVDHGTHRP